MYNTATAAALSGGTTVFPSGCVFLQTVGGTRTILRGAECQRLESLRDQESSRVLFEHCLEYLYYVSLLSFSFCHQVLNSFKFVYSIVIHICYTITFQQKS